VPPVLKIGPMYVPGGPCFGCHETQLRRGSPLYDELVDRRRAETRPATTLGPASAIVGSLVAMDVMHLIAGGRRPATAGRALIVDMRRLESRWEAIEIDPECSLCGGAGAS
jgi:bacteriocin biosynthesis cyclodehydratase domain-containing protein